MSGGLIIGHALWSGSSAGVYVSDEIRLTVADSWINPVGSVSVGRIVKVGRDLVTGFRLAPPDSLAEFKRKWKENPKRLDEVVFADVATAISEFGGEFFDIWWKDFAINGCASCKKDGSAGYCKCAALKADIDKRREFKSNVLVAQRDALKCGECGQVVDDVGHGKLSSAAETAGNFFGGGA